jgi:hypothetical protein
MLLVIKYFRGGCERALAPTALPLPRVKMAFLCSLSNKHFPAIICWSHTDTRNERHDNIEAIYKKLTERRDTADVTALLKELHRIVNEAIRTQLPGEDQAEGLTFDLSKIDLEKLRNEFAKKVNRKATVIQDIRTIVEKKLADMLAPGFAQARHHPPGITWRRYGGDHGARFREHRLIRRMA